MVERIKQYFRKVYSRFRAWWYILSKAIEKLIDRPDRVAPAFDALINIRAAEILAVGHQQQIITGDSITHFGEAYFEGIPGVHCTGIGGDTTSTLLARLDRNILLFQLAGMTFSVAKASTLFMRI